MVNSSQLLHVRRTGFLMRPFGLHPGRRTLSRGSAVVASEGIDAMDQLQIQHIRNEASQPWRSGLRRLFHEPGTIWAAGFVIALFVGVISQAFAG